jgi:hypothetical protein
VHNVSSVFQYDSDDVDSHAGGVMADAGGEGRYASGERRRVTVDEATGRSRKKGRTREPKEFSFHRTEKATKRAARDTSTWRSPYDAVPCDVDFRGAPLETHLAKPLLLNTWSKDEGNAR